MDEKQPSDARGLCECGCGRKTTIAVRSDARKGSLKGQPRRFLHGHSGNKGRVQDLTGAWLVDEESGCWVWQRRIDRGGYAQVGARFCGGLAHRYIYELHRGPIPEGLHIDHLCRNRACVNPDHMEPVTNAENARRGANATLTMEDADRIRALLATRSLTGRAIAARFGVSESTVSLIKRGRIWT